MKRDCPIVLNGCPGVDSPITNTSSEAPDPLLFAGYGWSPYNPFRPPPLNGPPTEPVDCSNITWSEVSAELAQLFAQINAQFCTPPTPPPNPSPVPFPMPDLIPAGGAGSFITPDTLRFNIVPPTYQVFTNDRQTATVFCPNGSEFTMEIAAGSVMSPPLDPLVGPAWVEYINAYLQAFLLQQIYAMQVCLEVPAMNERTPPGVPPLPDGRGPTLAANPGWICAGDIPAAATNTYHISGQPGVSFTFSVSGNLPPGMTLVQTDPRTAVIQGTATTPGVYNYTVTATRTDAPSIQVSAADTYNVIGMTTTALPDGEVGTPYSFQLETVGAVAPVVFELVGSLPTGLSLSSSGSITGTPTTQQTVSTEIKMTDANGAVCHSTISIEVEAAPINLPDWDDLLWGVPTIFPSGTGYASFAPISSMNSGYSAAATGRQADGDDTLVFNDATLTYNGPAVTCYLHVDYQHTAAPCNDCNVTVVVNGVFIFNPIMIDTGPHVIPFNIPDTGGVPTVISVHASARYNWFTGCSVPDVTCTNIGFFSNSP